VSALFQKHWFARSMAVAPGSLKRSKRRLRILRSFTFNKGALAFYAPRITGQRAIVANYTMTGNGDSEFIRGASSRHCADGLRRTNTPRDVSVGHRCAGRYFPKRLPNALLEGRCPCRKLNPDVLVVQSAQNWHRQYTTA